MSSPTLLLIDPSMVVPEHQGMAVISAIWPGTVRTLFPALRNQWPTPDDLRAAQAVILLGSKASVHDDYPWLDALKIWLTPLLNAEVRCPTLGICFGHQLLAHLAGAKVGLREPTGHKLAAVVESHFSPNRLGVSGDLRVIASQCEEVKEIPRGFRHIATRPTCNIDGLEHCELPLFSVQFHPEAREDFALRQKIPAAAVDARLKADTTRLLEAFCQRALRSEPVVVTQI